MREQPREPIIFTSTMRSRDDLRLPGLLSSIEMAINPSSIEWDQPKRWTKRDVRDGSVFFHFTNSSGQNNDVLTLNFSGSTGNIGGGPGSTTKWLVWHNLYLLTREPVVLPDGTPNITKITYQSNLWTVPIEFSGFFNTVLKFSESADKPNSRDYSFGFTVLETSPDLDYVLTGPRPQNGTQT